MTIVEVTSSENTKTYTLRRFYAVYGRDGGDAILEGFYKPTLVAVKRIVNQHYVGANVEGWSGIRKAKPVDDFGKLANAWNKACDEADSE